MATVLPEEENFSRRSESAEGGWTRGGGRLITHDTLSAIYSSRYFSFPLLISFFPVSTLSDPNRDPVSIISASGLSGSGSVSRLSPRDAVGGVRGPATLPVCAFGVPV